MRILSITAGAAGMYCGSCFRDNALASELLSRGHDVLLVPVYTPTRTDEPNVSQPRVFYGGVSVYLQHHIPLFRHTPWLLDRLWDSPVVLNAMSRRGISSAPGLLGELTVSMLKGQDGPQRKELEKLLYWLQTEPAFDIVDLSNSMLIALAEPLKAVLGRPVCCTMQGEDLFLNGLVEPYRSQALSLIRSQIEHVDVFIAVSEYYADFMKGYLGIPQEKVHVVPLGVKLDGYTPAPKSETTPFTIGYFARIAPEKGLHVLCEAYRRLRREHGVTDARLEVGGYLGPEHANYFRQIKDQMRTWGLEDDFAYRGEVDRAHKIAFLQSVHVFSVPVTYDEPKGLSILEAMACGVPVIVPRRGALVEIMKKTSGGILVEPDDPEALAQGLLSLWKDSARREVLGRHGAAGVRTQYSAAHMADRALQVYQGLLGVSQPASSTMNPPRESRAVQSA